MHCVGPFLAKRYSAAGEGVKLCGKSMHKAMTLQLQKVNCCILYTTTFTPSETCFISILLF